MTEPQHELRVANDAAPEQNDEPRTPITAVPVARLLANPRRVRRA